MLTALVLALKVATVLALAVIVNVSVGGLTGLVATLLACVVSYSLLELADTASRDQRRTRDGLHGASCKSNSQSKELR